MIQPEDLVRFKPYVFFGMGVLCGNASAKAAGVYMILVGFALYGAGRLLDWYVKAKRT